MASNNYINECKNRANGNRLGKIIVNGIETPITNSDNLQSFSIDSGCYVDGNIIGSIYIKCLNGEFISVSDNVELIDKIIHAQIGVKYSDNTTEYINMGKYTIERPNDEKTANMSQIKAYDDLINKIDNKYVCGIDYTNPKTLSDLYIDLCNQLELTPVTTTFLNSTIPINSNPFTNGEKNRVVLQTILKVSCSFATIDDDNDKIDLSWLSSNSEPDYIFEKNDYSTLEGGTIQYGPVNSVTIKNSQIDDENVTQKDNQSITENGEHSIVISEDYILYNAELRQQAITAIFNRLNGLEYVDSKLITYYGKPFLKAGSKIRIKTGDGINDYFDTYILKHKFSYDGTFYSDIQSPALTEQEIKTKQDISLQEKLSNTQIEVNKQSNRIVSLVSEVNTTRDGLEQLQNELEETTSGLQNTLTYAGGNNLILNAIGELGDTSYWQPIDDDDLCLQNYTSTYIQNKTGQISCWMLNNGNAKQTIQVSNGKYTLSGIFENLLEFNETSLTINGINVVLEDEFEQIFEISDNHIDIVINNSINNGAYLMNLMINKGETKLSYSNNANEIITDTVTIGKGIQIKASGANTSLDAQADGIRIKKVSNNETVTEFTDKGVDTDEIISDKGIIAQVLIMNTGNQTWFNRL